MSNRVTTAYDELYRECDEKWQGDLPKLTMEDSRRGQVLFVVVPENVQTGGTRGEEIRSKIPTRAVQECPEEVG